MTTICPFATWRPVPSHSGPMTAHRGLVLHVQVGTSSCYPWFAIPANQASSTWWVGRDGTLEQYVDADMAAWAEAAGNSQWDSVETEGEPTDPLSDAQVATLARLYAWGHGIYAWPYQTTDDTAGTGFGWHGMGGAAWGGHTGCPGDLRKAQRTRILTLAQTPSTDQENLMAFGPSGNRVDLCFVAAGGAIMHRWGSPDTWATCLEEQVGRPGVDKALAVLQQGWLADGSAYIVIIEGTDHKVYLAENVGDKWSGFVPSAGQVAA